MPANSNSLWKRWLIFACLCISLLAAIFFMFIRDPRNASVFDAGLSLLFFLFCFGLGIYLWVMNKSAKGEQMLVLFLALFGTLLVTWSAGRTDYGRLVCQDVYLLAFIFGLVLCIKVITNYLAFWNLVWMSKRSLIAIDACAASISILVTVGRGMDIAGAQSLAMIFVAALMVLILAHVVWAYRRYDQVVFKPMLQVLLLGLSLAFIPNLALSVFPALWQDTLVFHPISGLFLLFLPLTLFYLMISDRFMDVSFVVTGVTYCALIAALPALILSAAFQEMTEWGVIVSDRNNAYRFGLIAFISLFTILYIKQYLDYYLRKRLYPKQQDVQTSLNRFLQWMKSDYDLNDFSWIMKREMEACLPVDHVRLSMVGKGDPSDERTTMMPSGNGDHGSDQLQDELGKIVNAPDGFRILLSESGNGKVVLEGEWKQPRRRLNPDERIWLATLTSYAQMVIENLANTKDLMQKLEETSAQSTSVPLTIKKMMLRISERERWKLSRSLHDRNMQDQLDIARQLDSWGSNASDLKTKALMVKFREQILDSVYVLRQVINDLHPEFIYRTGLRKALMELFDKVNLRADFTLRATIDEQMDGFQREWEMAVYRVVQELLNNAQKHSHAHLVTLNLIKTNDAFTLNYSDDGVGLDVSKIGKSFGTMGFPGMIGRVEGLGGRIQFRSGQGDGLKITIQWARKADDAK